MMLLGEPPRTQGDLNFRLFGVPVRVHPLFWLVAVLLNLRVPNLTFLAMWVAAVFVGILVHEFGHATVMRIYGFYPWITLYGMGGLASYHPGSYTVRGRSATAQVLISAAGPVAGFLLAGLILLGVRLAGYRVAVGLLHGIPVAYFQQLPLMPLDLFLTSLLQVCLYWGLLNLLPILPLDGGQIASQVLGAVNPRNGQRQALMLSVVVGSLMAAMSLLRWNDAFLAILFGYMAYGSYLALQAYSGRGYF
jgi:Zn-dependent protease